MPRIGLLGGSFDPVHLAHLALARAAQQALQLDELRFVPAGQPWQKLQGPGARAITPAADRVSMLQAAIADAGQPPGWVLDRCEIDRAGPSYSIDTVAALQAARPGAQWWLVIGQDQLARLHTWHRWRDLLQRVHVAVAARPGAPLALAPEVQAVLDAPTSKGWQRLPMPAMDVSATDIRARAAAGADLSQLVPPGVARYIAGRHLYAALAHGAPGS